MAEVILGPLVQDLNSLIQREVRLVWRVKADLRDLSSTLDTIRAVLADAEELQIKSKEVRKRKKVRDWLMKLQDAAYDAQDILEDWAVADEARRQFNAATRIIRVRKSFLSLLNLKRLLFRYKIARRVKEIRGRFDQIAKDKSDFHFTEGVVVDVDRVVNTHHTIDPTRETSSFSNEPQIYGRDEDRENIVKILLENKNIGQGIAVCPIYGIGGLGKTTLAQLVFNDDRVQKHFDAKIWICVSDPFNGKRLLKEIVHLVTGKPLDDDNLDEVQKSVLEAVRGKKFLLVLDDVWSKKQDDFNMLKKPLSSGAEGSSIVVTTRSEQVASIAKAILEPYKLGDLSENHCWSLFKSYAFDGKEKPHLERTGREIFKKCGGLPLAAKALGSLLRFKDDEEQWKQVLDSEIWELEEDDEILPALRLSYYNLSPRERQCFAYCSFFPKDYKMRKEEIVHLWWANGLLQNRTMGENVFNQLKLHSFFQDMEEDENEITFKIHDLLHDLASSVMKMEHSCNVLEVGRNTTYDIQDDKIRPRHMSITMSPSSQSSSAEVSRLSSFLLSRRYHLRTLFLFSNKDIRLRLSSGDVSIISGFKYLRVLKIDRGSCILKELPPSLGKKLKHLRMLSLSWCGISSLQAKFFRGMINLQFLDLSYNQIETLPHLIRQSWKKLRYLDLCGCGLSSLEASSFCGMKTLQSLNLSKNSNIGMLPNAMGEHLEDLRHLNLSKCGLSSLQTESFQGMKKLETLDLSENKKIQTLPDSIGRCLESLRRLCLAECRLCLLPDEVFSGMRNMKFLDLSDNCKIESLPDSIGNLEELRHLNLSKNRYLRTLPESLGNLTELETLKLNGCGGLTLLPQNTSKLCSLKHLENEDCNGLGGMPSGVGQHLTQLEKLSLWVCSIGETDNIKELRALNLLTGLLEIRIIQGGEARHLHWEEVEEDALTNKTNLSQLFINFVHSYFHDEDVSRMEEQVLRVLKPPINIEDLRIHDYAGRRFPNWMEMRDPHSSFPRLKNFELMHALNVVEWWLNWSDKECLPALQHLKIWHLPCLKALPEALGNLTSLKSMEIGRCYELVSIPTALHELTSLESLEIRDCEKIMSLPQLISLKRLCIQECPRVIIPDEELETLVALQHLEISGLHSLPTALHKLTSLETLQISYCRELVSLSPQLQLLTSLKRLEIRECPKLKFIFHGLRHLTSLNSLFIHRCPGVVIPKEELETLVGLPGSKLYHTMVDKELILDHDSTTLEISGKQVLQAPPNDDDDDDDDDGPQ